MAPDANVELSEDGGDPGDDSGQCTLSVSSDHYAENPLVCDSCMAQSCCAQNDACGSNPDCAALFTCAAFCEMDGGSSASCDSRCIQEHGAGGAAYVALMQCMDTSCDLQACFPLF